MQPGAWTRSNLTNQGYCLADAERHSGRKEAIAA